MISAPVKIAVAAAAASAASVVTVTTVLKTNKSNEEKGEEEFRMTIEEAFDDSRFEALDWNEENTEVLNFLKKKYPNEGLTKEKLFTYCEEAKQEMDYDDKYQEYIYKCAEDEDFKSRAEGLPSLEEGEGAEEETDAHWKKIWETLKINNKFKTEYIDKGSATITVKNTYEDVKNWCEEEGKVKRSTIKKGKKIEKEWELYLKACSVGAGVQQTDYWRWG